MHIDILQKCSIISDLVSQEDRSLYAMLFSFGSLCWVRFTRRCFLRWLQRLSLVVCVTVTFEISTVQVYALLLLIAIVSRRITRVLINVNQSISLFIHNRVQREKEVKKKNIKHQTSKHNECSKNTTTQHFSLNDY